MSSRAASAARSRCGSAARPVNVRVGAVVGGSPGRRATRSSPTSARCRTAVDTGSPGAAPLNELWLAVADGKEAQVASTLSQRPFAVLEKRSRSALEEDARRDPLGHGTLLALGAAALAALVLAVWGLVLAIRADLRDDRGELVDLEAQGATPSLLRRVVTARATIVAVVGVLGGIVGGVLLSRLVTRVVSVTARATTPEPPLVTTVSPAVLLVAGAVFAVCRGGARPLDHPARVLGASRPRADRSRRMTALVDLREVFVVHPSEDGGVAALRGLTLGVERGELCVVLGPSGAGKSTLVRVVAGLERPSAGLAVVDGLDIGAAPRHVVARHRARVVGYADQHYWRALSADLTGRGARRPPARASRRPGPERSRRARELLERVDLLDRADARPGELSGGEQQRIALCAALAPSPALLVADEPTGELDEATAQHVVSISSPRSRARKARRRSSSATTPRPRRSPTASSTSATGASARSAPEPRTRS